MTIVWPPSYLSSLPEILGEPRKKWSIFLQTLVKFSNLLELIAQTQYCTMTTCQFWCHLLLRLHLKCFITRRITWQPSWAQFSWDLIQYKDVILPIKKSHCTDKTVVRWSYLHNGISYTSKRTSSYWTNLQAPCKVVKSLQTYLKNRYL